MTAEALDTPFDRRPLTEVRLESAPLALVLVQVRHPALVLLTGPGAEETVLQLAHRLADNYPILEQIREKDIVITATGVTESQGLNTIWRLKSGDGQWRISVSSQFIALDTSRYSSRADFRDRFDRILSEYTKLVRPPSVERIGLRYVNRLESENDLAALSILVRPEVLGPSAVACPPGTKLVHALTQLLYQSDTFGLKAQWGNLPPGAVFDPTVEATDKSSWILDIDSFTNRIEGFDRAILLDQLVDLADRAYRLFRWAVTDKYLDRFKR